MTNRYRIAPLEEGGYKVQIKASALLPWLDHLEHNGLRREPRPFGTIDEAKAWIDKEIVSDDIKAKHMAMAYIEHPPGAHDRGFWRVVNWLFIGAAGLWVGAWIGIALVQHGVIH